MIDKQRVTLLSTHRRPSYLHETVTDLKARLHNNTAQTHAVESVVLVVHKYSNMSTQELRRSTALMHNSRNSLSVSSRNNISVLSEQCHLQVLAHVQYKKNHTLSILVAAKHLELHGSVQFSFNTNLPFSYTIQPYGLKP